ncbi:MAG: helicase HerA-like domain-containing protein [Nitrososphaerota archaeon]
MFFKKKLKIKKEAFYNFLSFSSPYTFTRTFPSINDSQRDIEQEKFQEQIYLGWSIESGFEKSKEYLNINNINRHVIIFGSTGTGKTTTTSSIALRLWEKGFPILILDWHNEYGKIAEKINGKIFPLGKDNSYSINPFKPLFLEDDIYTHIDMLCDIFSETFNFSAPQSYMFLKALVEEYKARGFLNKEVEKLEAPNLLAILERIQKIAPYSRFDYEIKMALERRLQPLTLGQLGEIFCGENIIKIDDIMQGFTVIELGHIKSYLSKRILLYLILKLIYDYCIHRKKMNKLIHVTIIEEAQNIVPMRKDSEMPSIGERLIFDVRKFGEGIILIAQLPSQISDNITKNVSMRIIHAIKGKNDIAYSLRKNGIYEGEKILQSLREGEAIIDSIGKRSVKIVYIEPHEMLGIK